MMTYVAQGGPRVRSASFLVWPVFDALLLFVSVIAFLEPRFGLGSILWLLCYGMTIVRFVTVPNTTVTILLKNLVYLFFPICCFLSVIWSILPDQTAISSLQLSFTVLIGMNIGFRYSVRTIAFFMYIVASALILISLVNWRTGMFGTIYAPSGGLLGVFAQKNVFGKTCLSGLLSAVYMVLCPGIWRLWRLSAIVMIPIMTLAIFLSQSVTNILLFPVFAGMIILLSYRYIGVIRLPLFLAIALVACFGPLLAAISGFDPVGVVLGAFSKNSSLTGRTDIWVIGERLIAMRPLLGVGYSAFWDAPSMQTYAYVAQAIGGENVRAFHNFIIEVWVASGIPGVVGIALTILTTLSRTTKWWLRTRSLDAGFALAFSTSLIVVSLVEPGLYRPHTITTLLIVSFGVAAWRAAAVHKAQIGMGGGTKPSP